jgi:hypothetical protein
VKMSLRWILLGLGIASTVAPVFGQAQQASVDAFQAVSDAGLPTDWTHRHAIFSSPSYRSEILSSAQQEPRYWLQLLRRLGSQDAASSDGLDAAKIAAAQLEREQQRYIENHDSSDLEHLQEWEIRRRRRPRHEREPLERDWTQTFSNGTTYTISSPTYPAKFSLSSANPTPNCTSDYVAFALPTGSSVFPGSFNMIGFNNLYVTLAGGASFCPGTAPQAIFEYNASTAGGALNGSPALSLDGTLIAFVENATSANGGAVFHVLKWHSGDVQKIDTLFPHAFNLVALANCATNGAAAPCEYSLSYTPAISSNPASLSSPFIDYGTDTAYVSDDGGNVYAIAPVFNASSANPPVVKTGWPINVGSAAILTPPVYDSVSKNVFVASSGGTEFFIKASGSTVGSCVSGVPPCLGSSSFAFTGGGTIQEAPIVDSSTGRVFLSGTQLGGSSGSYVVQTDTALSAASVQPGKIGVGTVNVLHPGAPDNNYFTSVGTGKFYACGQSTSGEAQLYAFGFNSSGVMNTTAVSGSPVVLGNNNTVSSPCNGGLTEIFNRSASKDWLFVGVKNHCVGTVGGTNGCIMSFDITTAFPTTFANQLALVGGGSGIVVDNVTDAAATTITTDIYSLLTGGQSCPDYNGSNHTGTCAVSATQSGLQ